MPWRAHAVLAAQQVLPHVSLLQNGTGQRAGVVEPSLREWRGQKYCYSSGVRAELVVGAGPSKL